MVKTSVGWIAHSNEWSTMIRKEPIIEPVESPIEEHEEIPIKEPIVEDDNPSEVVEPKTNWFVELIKAIIQFIQSFMKGDKK